MVSVATSPAINLFSSSVHSSSKIFQASFSQIKSESEMNLTKEIKKQALKAGFVCVGITSPEMLLDLPHGWVCNVINLRTPEEELEDVNSVIHWAIMLGTNPST